MIVVTFDMAVNVSSYFHNAADIEFGTGCFSLIAVEFGYFFCSFRLKIHFHRTHFDTAC